MGWFDWMSQGMEEDLQEVEVAVGTEKSANQVWKVAVDRVPSSQHHKIPQRVILKEWLQLLIH